MGFSPDFFVLKGEINTGRFLVDRPGGCPHKGLDISSGINKALYAGYYALIVPTTPNQSPWCTSQYRLLMVSLFFFHPSSSKGLSSIKQLHVP